MENEGINYSDYLYYDETSPTCLRWKVDRKGGAKVGDVAGYCYIDKEGKLESGLKINGEAYKPHRVVWCLHNGNLTTGKRVIFKDGNKLNHKVCNLAVQVKNEKVIKDKAISKYETYGDRPCKIFTGLRTRCGYNPSAGLKHYEGKTIHQKWLDDPTLFYKFVVTLDNYNSVDDKGKPFHIEKDLFGINSEVKGYHPHTICFLPNDLNQILQLEHPNQRTVNKGLPLGVTQDGNRYKAQISAGGKPRYLGSGTTDECSILYKTAKILRIKELTDKWKHVLSDKILNQLELFVEHLRAI